jgi:hypothetical protein
VPVKIAWHENFNPSSKYRRRYKIEGTLDDKARRAFGLDLSSILTGPVSADVGLLETAKGRGDAVIKFELKDAEFRLSPFGWTKPPGKDGIAWLSLKLQNRKLVKIPNLDIRMQGFRANAKVIPATADKPMIIDLRRFVLGATDISGRIVERRNGVYDIALRGPGFDAAPFFDFEDDSDTPEFKLPPISLTMNFDRMWFSTGQPIERVSGRAVYDGNSWVKLGLRGLLPRGHKVDFDFSTKNSVRKFAFNSSNAGAALRALDLFNNVEGGKLSIKGLKDRKAANPRWQGELSITDFQVSQAPLLARLLSLASLPGIVNALTGKGVVFNRLALPYVLEGKALKITKARSVGPALGLTADGVIDYGKGVVELDGTIVPAYTINSVLGAIPILGTILTGVDKTGVFAASFKIHGPTDKPTITVNPLTALAPGFLRDLVGIIFSSGKGPRKIDATPPKN